VTSYFVSGLLLLALFYLMFDNIITQTTDNHQHDGDALNERPRPYGFFISLLKCFVIWIKDTHTVNGERVMYRRTALGIGSCALLVSTYAMHQDLSITTKQSIADYFSNLEWPAYTVFDDLFEYIDRVRRTKFIITAVSAGISCLAFAFALVETRLTFALSCVCSLAIAPVVFVAAVIVGLYDFASKLPTSSVIIPCAEKFDRVVQGAVGSSISLFVAMYVLAQFLPIFVSVPVWLVRVMYQVKPNDPYLRKDILVLNDDPDQDHYVRDENGQKILTFRAKFCYYLALWASTILPPLLTLLAWVLVQQFYPDRTAEVLMFLWFVVPPVVIFLTWPKNRYVLWLIVYVFFFLLVALYIVQREGELKRLWDMLISWQVIWGAVAEICVSYAVVADYFYLAWET